LKSTANFGATPSHADTRRTDAGPPAEAPRSGSSPMRQRVGPNAATGVLSNPPPAASAAAEGSRLGPRRGAGDAALRAATDRLTDSSDHTAATVQAGNARPRARSFDDVVQVRYFDNTLPARSHSGEGEMPLRSVAHAKGPRRSRRPGPEAPQAAPASRWDSGAAGGGAAGGPVLAPRRRAAVDDLAPAAAAPAPRPDTAAPPRLPVRKPDRGDGSESL
jgi:hypothetical protein